VDVAAVQALWPTIGEKLNGVRDTLREQASQQMPVGVTYSDRNMTQLLEALATNATTLGIPISGTTREERFRSMNDWLNSSWRGRSGLTGRNRDSTIDQAAFDELLLRVRMAAIDVQADAAAQQGGGVVVPPQPQPQPQPQVVAGGEQQRATGGAVPQTVDTMRADSVQILADLAIVAEHGRTEAVKRSARDHISRINREFENQRPNLRNIGQRMDDARTFLYGRERPRRVEGELDRSLERAVQQRLASYGAREGHPHDLATEYTQLESALRGATGVGAEIYRRLPDIWLVGDEELRQMFNLLKEANQALQGGNETQAREKLRAAGEIFDREQALYSRWLERVVLPIATSMVTEVHSSSLPQRADLVSAGRANRSVYEPYTLRDQNGRNIGSVHVGRDDVERALQRRVDAANALLRMRGHVSFQAVQDLQTTVERDERFVHSLVSMYNSVRGERLDGYAAAGQFWEKYAAACAAIVEPTVNPLNNYSQQQQLALIRLHLGVPQGTELTSAQVATGRRELSRMFMQNLQFTYDEALFGVFDHVVRMTTQSGESALQSMASVRSLRLALELEYTPYANNVLPYRIRGVETDQIERQTTEQMARHRFDLARLFLERSVASARAAGMGDRDEVILAARAWITHTATAPTESGRLVSYADMMYNMALGLLSIREAELWAADTSQSLRSSSTTSSTVTTARSQIERARRMFVAAFSHVEASPAFHYNLPRNLADDAIGMLAPHPFALTEASAMYVTRSAYLNPSDYGVGAAGSVPTDEQMLEAARSVEQRYLSFLVRERNEGRFSTPVSQSVLADLSGPIHTLHMRVGRIPVRLRVGAGHPLYRNVLERRRPSVSPIDQHFMPRSVENHPVLGGADTALADQPHEDAGHNYLGGLYVEYHRQAMMLADVSTPSLLHGFDIAPNRFAREMMGRLPSGISTRDREAFQRQYNSLQTRIEALARDLNLPLDQPLLTSLQRRISETSAAYAGAEAEAQQRELNRLLLGFLDVRIAQLEAATSGNVVLTQTQAVEGRQIPMVVPVADLERSTDPRAYEVTRARAYLREARQMREQFGRRMTSDLLAPGPDPREAIAISEEGLASAMRFPDIRYDIPPVTITAYTPASAIEVERLSGDPRRVRFTASRVMVRDRDGAETPLAAYERQHGAQNLTYFWFMYQDLGRRERGEPIQYLLNPDYRESGQPRYIGQVMRGVTVVNEDGTRVRGDFVVRVRATGQAPSTGPEWAPIVERDGTIRSANALYQVQAGTLEPIRDARLERNMSHEEGRLHVCRERASPSDTVIEYGPTTPVLVIRPSATRARQ
jgi:hypothetical protein